MCGIAGIAGRSGGAAADAVTSMVASLAHRGPDDRGVKTFDGAVLGHARLSIIDLKSGHQPLGTRDGRFWITFNGEIYNYRVLRAELERDGYAFQTTSDTEVLIAAYKRWNVAAFERLNGMYACVIWDDERKRMLALRDRTGKKPFFYALQPDGAIAFASEVKALLDAGLASRRVEPEVIDAYLALGYVPPDRSVFGDVRVLPAASYLEWQDGRVGTHRYWQPKLDIDESIDEASAVEELRRRMDRAVSSRMIADVPIGAFLSGGLDSTTVVALMARHATEAVRTFSVGFGDLINELPQAGAVARRFATDHHEIQLELDVGELLGRMADIYDEPLADSSSVPTYVVSRFAAQNVKVVLTGDGGDELFGGYDWWYRPLAASERVSSNEPAYLALRVATRSLAVGARLGLPVDAALSQLWEHRQLVELAREHPDLWDRQRTNATRFPEELRRSLWRREWRRVVGAPPAALCPDSVRGMNRAFWFDITSYLPGDILVKLDRASMAVGLEARCPLLDPDVIEFALSLPTSLKLSGEGGKHVFKRAFEALWPDEVRGRAKHGFGAPEEKWLRRDDVQTLVQRVLLDSGSALAAVFDMDEVARRARAHYASRSGFSGTQMWSLLSLGLWAERWKPAF